MNGVARKNGRSRARWMAAALTCLLAAPAVAMNFIVELSQADLQRKVERLFPFEHTDALYQVQLARPQVVLREDSDRIGLRLDVTGSAMQQIALAGKAYVNGRLRFEPKTGSVYLDDAALDELHIDGVPPEYANQLRTVAEQMARELLASQPIYVLEKGDGLNKIMGSEVKSVAVRHGKLVLELAMF